MGKVDVPLVLGKAAEELAETVPNQVLCQDAYQTLTARDVHNQALFLARALLNRGFGPGQVAALLLPGRAETLSATVGVTRTGALAALLLPDYGVEELPRILSLAPPDWLFFAPEHSREAAAIAAAFRPKLVALQPSDHPELEEVLPWARLLEEGALGQTSLPVVTPNHDAVILFTSGSTGSPKALIRTHNSAMSHGRLLNEYSHFGPGATMSFRRFRYEDVCQLLVSGGALLIADPTDTATWHALDADQRTTHFYGVASDLEIWVSQVQRGAVTLNGLQQIIVGGMATPLELARRAHTLLGRSPLRMFGTMETGLLAVNDGRPELPHESIGLPVAGKELQLLNDGQRIARGEVGELAARPRGELELGFARGYAGATQSPWKDGWIYTGDLMVSDEHGHLYIVGRRFETINVGGYKVYAPEVERVLSQHAAVADVAVVGQQDERHGQRLLAYVALKSGHTVGARTLRAHCRTHLAAHKIPRRILFVDRLPRTATGKVDKAALQGEPAATVRDTV